LAALSHFAWLHAPAAARRRSCRERFAPADNPLKSQRAAVRSTGAPIRSRATAGGASNPRSLTRLTAARPSERGRGRPR
jgi:hypothetical protein